MSGIATLTRQFADKLKGYTTRILDSRKTTPNFRLLEKEAVRIGGGENHRFGLYDMIMLKDNHIDYCGGITQAVEMAWDYVHRYKPGLKIEVETRNMEEVREVLAVGHVHRVLLDNFSPDQIREALVLIAGRLYSTDPKYRFEESDAPLPETLPSAKQQLRLRLDTRQRAGKAVTLVEGFSGMPEDLETLGKKLKTFCGTGGSVKDGVIVIQGDQRDKILAWLLQQGYQQTRKI
jgi:predicted translation initiation factor SUI1